MAAVTMSGYYGHPGHDAIASTYAGHFVHPYPAAILETPQTHHSRDADPTPGLENTHDDGDGDERSRKRLPPSILAKKARQQKPPGYVRPNAIWVTEPNGSKRVAKATEFKDEIIERSQRGETCDQISDALAARGITMSSPSVGRWRLSWGISKRAKRRNAKPPKPHSQKAAVGKKTYRGRKVELQTKHKGEITLMTSQGLSPEDIAKVMQSRGMDLKKGATTILRLQTAWGLLEQSLEHRIKNARHLARRKAKEEQQKSFESYAKELQLKGGDAETWVDMRMAEPSAKKLKDKRALELMAAMAPPEGWPPGSLRLGRPRGEGASPGTIKTPTKTSAQKRTPTKKGGAGKELHKAVYDFDDSSSHSDSDSDMDDMSQVFPSAQSQHQRMDYQEARESDGDGEADSDIGQMMMQDNHSDSSEDDAGNETLNGSLDVPLSQDPSLSLMHNLDAQPPQPSSLGMAPSALDCDDLVSLLLPGAIDSAALADLISSAERCISAASDTMTLLSARMNATPAPNSITGLPPSQADLNSARARFREIAKHIAETF